MRNKAIWQLNAVLVLAGALYAGTKDQKQAPAAANDQQAAPNQAVTERGFQDRYPRYQLVEGDVIELTFEFSPEFNQSVTVQPDGFITLKSLGDIHVSGLTVPQVTKLLETSYAKILNQPAIAAVLKDFEKPYFTAGGQVGHPGKYVLHGNTSVTEAIAMAGGFTEKSKHSQVLVFRRVSSEWTEARVVDVKKMMNAKNLHEDMYLRTGDMIFVPQNRFSKISRFIPTSGVSTYINPTQY